MSRARRITGHLVVEERKDGPRVWVAKYMRTEGTPGGRSRSATSRPKAAVTGPIYGSRSDARSGHSGAVT
jgi:hypothetical protein